jgi:tRNA (guanine37-N1)-methyltransferase
MNIKPRAFDVLGNVAIVKFSYETKLIEKKKFANKILKENPSIKTILEKTGKFKGRLRKQETKFLIGVKTKEVLYKENNCLFRFNVDSTYFSPRLSNERKEIASKIKNENVLVMFSGVSPFSIVIAKNSKVKEVISVEINKEANKYAKLNVELNKLEDKVKIVQGDIKKLTEKLKKRKFDVIVMPRPQLKDSFLKQAFSLSKKGTRIYYYGFCKNDEISELKNKIKEEAKKSRKKIKILKVKHAGEVAPYKFRVRVDFKVL